MQTFVIKCPGTVSDDSLPKLTELRIPMLSYESQTVNAMEMSFDIASSVRMNVNDFYNLQGETIGKTLAASANANLYPQFKILNGGYFFINNYDHLKKFAVSTIPAFDFDLKNLQYCNALTNFACAGDNVVRGDIANFTNLPNATRFNVKGSNVVGNLTTFNSATHLTEVSLWVTSVTGKLSEFKNSLSLERLSCTSPDVEYDWEDLCDAQFANGRTSGIMRIESFASQVGDFRVQFSVSGWEVVA